MDIREMDQYAEEMRILNLRVCRQELYQRGGWDRLQRGAFEPG